MSMVRVRKFDGIFLMSFGSEHGVPRIGDTIKLSWEGSFKVENVVWMPEGDSQFPSPQVHVWLAKR